MARKQIFISHISEEGELAKYLKTRLDADFLGLLDVFVSSDRQTIQAGRKWLDQVDAALKAADVQVILCSKASIGRPWVNFEAGAAWLRGIPVIPLCHSGLRLTDLPVPLNMLQGVESGSPEGLQKLYDAIAAALDARTPAVAFEALAADLRRFSEAQRMSGSQVERIERPRILCAASAQYAQPSLGFARDAEILQQVFGSANVVVEAALTRKRLTDLLTSQRFDLVHFVTAVEPGTGDMIFSAVDLDTWRPAAGKVDRLSPTALASLLAMAQTRLVVLATCRALKLAVVLARSLNMVGTEEAISGEQVADWAECFYALLRQGHPLQKAFDLAATQVDAPLLLVPHRDLVLAACD